MNTITRRNSTYIFINKKQDVTSLDFKLGLRSKVAGAREIKGLTLFVVCDEAEKLEYLIDYDPYIFDSEGKININFIDFEEFSEKS
jgi:hypothetical protein